MKELKAMIEKMSRLSRRDQHWLNKKLAQKAPELLAMLAEKKSAESAPEVLLPAFTKQLAQEPALIIASVLLKEKPDWQDKFLHTLNEAQNVRETMASPPPPATTALIARVWREQIHDNFESMLESQHG